MKVHNKNQAKYKFGKCSNSIWNLQNDTKISFANQLSCRCHLQFKVQNIHFKRFLLWTLYNNIDLF